MPFLVLQSFCYGTKSLLLYLNFQGIFKKAVFCPFLAVPWIDTCILVDTCMLLTSWLACSSIEFLSLSYVMSWVR